MNAMRNPAIILSQTLSVLAFAAIIGAIYVSRVRRRGARLRGCAGLRRRTGVPAVTCDHPPSTRETMRISCIYPPLLPPPPSV